MRLIYPLIIVLLLGLIAGCSGPMPQRIHLEPEVVSVPRLPQSMPVSLEVNYPSKQLKIGTVADRLGNEVPVWITDNIRQEIQQSTIRALTRMGVTTTPNAHAKMSISIDHLTYNLRSDGLRRELIGEIQINLQVADSQRRYQGRFESDMREEVVRTPSEQKTNEFLNDLVSNVLFQALNDPEFTRFLIAGAR